MLGEDEAERVAVARDAGRADARERGGGEQVGRALLGIALEDFIVEAIAGLRGGSLHGCEFGPGGRSGRLPRDEIVGNVRDAARAHHRLWIGLRHEHHEIAAEGPRSCILRGELHRTVGRGREGVALVGEWLGGERGQEQGREQPPEFQNQKHGHLA